MSMPAEMLIRPPSDTQHSLRRNMSGGSACAVPFVAAHNGSPFASLLRQDTPTAPAAPAAPVSGGASFRAPVNTATLGTQRTAVAATAPEKPVPGPTVGNASAMVTQAALPLTASDRLPTNANSTLSVRQPKVVAAQSATPASQSPATPASQSPATPASRSPATPAQNVRAGNGAHGGVRSGIDFARTQALSIMEPVNTESVFGVPGNMNTLRNLRTVFGGTSLRAPVIPQDNNGLPGIPLQTAQINLLQNAARRRQGQPVGGRPVLSNDLDGPACPVHTATAGQSNADLGKLAAQFESGSAGISAIGYDRNGGTSYGKYQIASRVGSMDSFLKFLDTAAPDIAKSLRGAGPANTGSRRGAMPDMWRKIAAEQPDRFEALQEKFIYDSHYKPALEGILAKTSLTESQLSGAMQEVLWSTAVQHGPAGAVRIFSRAAKHLGDTTGKNFDTRLISNIYDIRAQQFGSSTEQVQNSVRNRMRQEKQLALNMLKAQNSVA